MSSILTPQQIYELDTFTLEEKIEELEASEACILYRQVLQLAKLELLERLEIEDFGRKLVNDEIKIEVEEVKLPPLTVNRHFGAKKSSNSMNQMMKKIQQCMITPQALSHIVRTSTNHSTKLFKNHRKVPETGKKQIVKKIQIPKALTKQKPKIRLPQEKIITQEKVPLNNVVVTKREKLKEEIKAIHLEYRQNDVYDDVMMIPMSPQKLIDCEEDKIEEVIQNSSKLQNQSQKTNEQTELAEQNSQIISEKIQSSQENTLKNNETNQIQLSILEEVEAFESTPKIQVKIEKKLIDQQTHSKTNSKTIATDAVSYEKYDIQIINLDNLCKQEKIQHPKEKEQCFNKEIRSVSLKNIAQIQSRKSIKKNNEILQKKQVVLLSLPQSTHQNAVQMTKLKKKGLQQNGSQTTSNFNVVLSLPLKQYYPYHEIIPSFTKLFPHSKNILITLKNIEDSLLQHFSKNIYEKSKNSEFARFDLNEKTYKVISQSEKAKKHNNLFDLDLKTFYSRGKIMLDRFNSMPDDHSQKNAMFYRVVRTKDDVYDIISSGFHRTINWFELVHGEELKSSWNLLWTWSKPQIDFGDLFYFQKVNHFIGNKQIARKDLLKKNIQKIKKLGPKMKVLFDIIPQTYLLPGENIQFMKKFKEYSQKNTNNYWILKPVGLSRGRGISVISKLQDIVFSQPIVLQRYLKNPLLLDGFKFDMRIYVLVTTMNPLQAYIYKEGFARISTERYSNKEQDIGNKFMHLTNFSINKENVQEKDEKQMTFQQKLGGCKISLKMLRQKLMKKDINWLIIENQIQDIILKSLVGCMNSIPSNPNCFQLFGYDIFVDGDLKCWLLQVNSSPSLEKDYTLDEIIKQQLIDDTIQLIQPVQYDRQKLLEVVQRRRKELEGLKSHINTNNNSAQQLDEDLHFILNGQPIRKYGQGPCPTNYKRVAPGNKYFQIVKAIQQYKIDPIIKAE